MRTVGTLAAALHGAPPTLQGALAARRPAAAPHKPGVTFATTAGLAKPRAIAVQAPRARVAPASPTTADFVHILLAQVRQQVRHQAAAARMAEVGGSRRFWRNHPQAARACGIVLP
jgi:hypothetical protein